MAQDRICPLVLRPGPGTTHCINHKNQGKGLLGGLPVPNLTGDVCFLATGNSGLLPLLLSLCSLSVLLLVPVRDRIRCNTSCHWLQEVLQYQLSLAALLAAIAFAAPNCAPALPRRLGGCKPLLFFPYRHAALPVGCRAFRA
jgi:hypothetical protein